MEIVREVERGEAAEHLDRALRDAVEGQFPGREDLPHAFRSPTCRVFHSRPYSQDSVRADKQLRRWPHFRPASRFSPRGHGILYS